MKKNFHVAVALIALLSSFTVSASAEFTSSDSSNLTEIKKQVQAIRDQLGYPPGGFSSLRDAVNHIANNLPASPMDYSTTLSNIYSNTSSLASTVDAIKGDINNISHRSTDILNKLADISTNIGTAQIAITNHIDSASTQNHADLTAFQQLFDTRFASYVHANNPDGLFPYVAPYFIRSSASYDSINFSWGEFLGNSYLSLTKDVFLYADATGYRRSLYGLISQLQQVLASDDDLALKDDNKANQDAATDAFVNGSSSPTSLGPADIGNLKDVGGTFNDLTSLNGQSSVTSFLNGLSSADGIGRGWFSESTRASLDAVSPPPTNKVCAFDVYRGERSSTYVILPDVSLVSPDMYFEPVDVASSISPDDPYNMSGFEDNYNWLWGDVS